MSVNLPVQQALNIYLETITVVDNILTIDALGEQSRIVQTPRVIRGSAQFEVETEAVLSQTGAFPDKVLTVFTVGDLYISGILNSIAALPGENYQSYIIFSHGEWKVTKVEDWKAKTSGVSKYICTRYVNLTPGTP